MYWADYRRATSIAGTIEALERNRIVVTLARGDMPHRLADIDHYDLVFIDDIDASSEALASMIEAIRARSDIGIFVMVQRGDPVSLLQRGADDVVTDADIRVGEILARTVATIRRTRIFRRDSSCCGGVSVNRGHRRASKDGVELGLTYKELVLLACLVDNCGQVVPRETLLSVVWGSADHRWSRSLDTHIHSLRRKIGIDMIETIRGIGYRLTGTASSR